MAENQPITIGIAYTIMYIPPDFKKKIRKLREKLQFKGYEVRELVGFEDGTAADIYIRRSHEEECDLLVAVCNYGSTELGYWMGLRLAEEKPLLLAAFPTERTPRIIVDAELVGSYVRATFPRNVEELVESIVNFLKPPARLGSKLPEIPESEDKGTKAVA